MKKTIISSTLLIILVMVSSFKSSAQEKETRNHSGFSKINFGVAGNLFINIGPEFKVVLEGEEDLLEDIITEVTSGKLVIRKENSWNFTGSNEKLTIYVTVPELDGLGVSGSGKAEIRDAVKTANLGFSVSGSGRIITNEIQAENLECNISGSGNITLGSKGTVRNAEIGISGSGNYSGESFEIENAEVSISGSGNCKCNVTGALNARVSGSGDVYYAGNPKIDARVSGSGKVRSL